MRALGGNVRRRRGSRAASVGGNCVHRIRCLYLFFATALERDNGLLGGIFIFLVKVLIWRFTMDGHQNMEPTQTLDIPILSNHTPTLADPDVGNPLLYSFDLTHFLGSGQVLHTCKTFDQTGFGRIWAIVGDLG